MKIPTKPAGLLKQKPKGRQRPCSPEESKRRKAQSRLEALNYTPQTARLLSNALRAMAIYDTPTQRDARLETFSEIAKEK